ncbi:cysteine peptidase family C39 domain-containing protein [bacterium]|nr:cysteine peptidase family C39 domain-containing protein [bacterium]
MSPTLAKKLNQQKPVKTPSVLQMESTDCGAAALAIILGYYGCFVPIEELRLQCGVSRDGVSTHNLIKAAGHYGLKADLNHQVPKKTITQAFPCILFWDKRHFVVLEGFKGDKVYINDPKKGRYVMMRSVFDTQFSGASIQFNLTDRFEKCKQKKPILNLFRQLLKEEYVSLGSIFLYSLLLILPNIATPMFSKSYIDHYVLQNQTAWLSVFFKIMLWVVGLQALFNFLQQSALRRFECKYAKKLASTLIHHLLALPTLFFASRNAGDLSLRPQATQLLAITLTGPICAALTGSIQLLVYLGFMLYFSPLLSLIACVFASANLCSMLLSKAKKSHLAALTTQQIVDLSALTASYISMVPQIKAMGSEQTFFAKWQENLNQHLHSYRQLASTHATTQAMSLFLSTSAHAVTIGVGAVLTLHQQMTLGDLMAFNLLFFAFNQSILQCIKLGNQFHLASSNYQRITDITAYPNAITQHHQSSLSAQYHGKIEIIDLTFGYSPFDTPLFNKLNLTIEAKSKVAIVGCSGSGKTTLVNLIAGIYQPWSGTILIDGQPLVSLSAEMRVRLMGVVSQEQFFYQGSIRDNLCLWETTHTDVEIMDAVRAACIDEFISQLEDGLDFQLTDGATNLSGGQRQRLEIARTLLIKPKILLLDEATNTLDPLIEQHIDNHLSQQKITTISIAHRFNSIRHADKIFILKQGILVDSGTHQSLTAQQSRAYLELFSHA